MLWCPIYSNETDSALQCLDQLRKQVSLESFMKSRDRKKVPDVRRNLVPDTWTADGEGALPELGPCPHDRLTENDGHENDAPSKLHDMK